MSELSGPQQAALVRAKQQLKASECQWDCLNPDAEIQAFMKNETFMKKLIKYVKNQERAKRKRLSKASDSENELTSHLDEESERLSCNWSSASAIQTETNQESLMPPKIFIDAGESINQEIINSYLQTYSKLDPMDRYSFFEGILERNPTTLLDFCTHLKKSQHHFKLQGLFNTLNELLLKVKLKPQTKTRLFASALKFYNYETYGLSSEMLASLISLLITKPDPDQVLGLANLIFMNQQIDITPHDSEIIRLDKANLGTISRMWSTFEHFLVDRQVQMLIPNTFLVLNQPFIQLLKQNKGMDLIRDISSTCFQPVVKIAALIKAPSYESLHEFITLLRESIDEKWDYVDNRTVQQLLYHVSEQLEKRNPAWVGQPEHLLHTLQQTLELLSQKGITLGEEQVVTLAEGDISALEPLKEVPMQVSFGLGVQFDQVLHMLSNKNLQSREVKAFVKGRAQIKSQYAPLLEAVQQKLNFHLHPVQQVCLEYLLSSKSQRSAVEFGIGNGKTLISVILAVLLCKLHGQSTYIVSKSEHLIFKEHRDYQQLIAGEQLASNCNEFGRVLGVYFFSEKSFRKLLANESNGLNPHEMNVIIDEYDWVLFDNSVPVACELLTSTIKFSRLVLISGSRLTITEQSILKQHLDLVPVVFPTISALDGDRTLRLKDSLIISSLPNFKLQLECLLQSNLKKSPTIIVAGHSYALFDDILAKIPTVTHFSLKSKTNNKIDTLFEQRFTQPDAEGNYGVYLLSEFQGRGTDFKSTKEVEANGGNYLIVGDVFSSRSLEQVRGRVGRLGKRGRWHYFLFDKSSKLGVKAYIENQQHELNNSYQSKVNKLLSLSQSLQVQKPPERKPTSDSKFQEQEEEKFEENVQVDPNLESKEALHILTPTKLQILDKVLKKRTGRDLINSQVRNLMEASARLEGACSQEGSEGSQGQLSHTMSVPALDQQQTGVVMGPPISTKAETNATSMNLLKKRESKQLSKELAKEQQMRVEGGESDMKEA